MHRSLIVRHSLWSDPSSVKYSMSKQTAIKTYHNAVNRVLAVIHAMDTGEVPTKQVDFWKKKVEERSGSLPKGQKWYLLN